MAVRKGLKGGPSKRRRKHRKCSYTLWRASFYDYHAGTPREFGPERAIAEVRSARKLTKTEARQALERKGELLGPRDKWSITEMCYGSAPRTLGRGYVTYDRGRRRRPAPRRSLRGPKEYREAQAAARRMKKAGTKKEDAAPRLKRHYNLTDFELRALLASVWAGK